MTTPVDIIQALLTLPIGPYLSILLVGIIMGSYLGKREAQSTSEQFIQDYRRQKNEMWDKVKEQIAGVMN